MSIRQLPSPRWTIPGNSGVVAAGYYVYTYQPGTSTPKATYTDHTGATPNTNPIVLDARGEANIWWDGQYKVLAYTGDKDAGGVLVWSQDNYGEGTSAVLQGNFNLVLNGSFEQDTNGDDLPDDWTIVEYTDGQVERDSLEQIHGSYSLKCTSVGTGGGYADSTLFEVQEARVLPVSFALKSSIATVHNQVDVVWYTASGAVLSTTTLYDDATTNPTDWTTFNYSATPPTNARFGKIRIFGCKDDNAQPGSVWFDNVIVDAAASGLFPNVTEPVTATHSEINALIGVDVVGWNISLATYANKLLDTSSEDASPAAAAQKTDGTKMYVAGAVSNTIFQYALSDAWDISTASYEQKSKDVSGELSSPSGIVFSDDGSMMYVSSTLGLVYQYEISSPWDVSTASYTGKSFNYSTEVTSAAGQVAFSDDFSYMFATGGNNSVFRYVLSTPGDVSTASYAGNTIDVSGEISQAFGIAFSGDGSLMYVSDVSGKAIKQYELAAPWDLSSALHMHGLSMVRFDAPTYLSFSTEGSSMYTRGSGSVKQFRIGYLSVFKK